MQQEIREKWEAELHDRWYNDGFADGHNVGVKSQRIVFIALGAIIMFAIQMIYLSLKF